MSKVRTCTTDSFFSGQSVCEIDYGQIKGMVIRSREDGAHYFVPGRKAMTCCADDIRFLGYLCRSDLAPKLTEGEWVRVTGTVKEEYNSVYQGRGPVIWAQEIEKADPPEEELVFFS